MTPVPTARKRDVQNSGSPGTGEPVYLIIGKLRRTHGVNGDLLMDVLTDNPESLTAGLSVFVGPKHKPMKITHLRFTVKAMIIGFEGFTDCDQASILRNQEVAIKTSEAQPLNNGRFYHHEIIGMQVVDEAGDLIGIITEILATGANDVYVVKPVEGNELLIPAVKEFVKKIDPANNRMVVQLPQWE
jgi:16S rRNA processing protein RimM